METKKCGFCGEVILIEAIKCKHCGEFLNGQKQPQNKSSVEDRVIHEDECVKVTPLRLIIKNENKTYAMSNVTTVSCCRLKKDYKWPIRIIVIGIALILWTAFGANGIVEENKIIKEIAEKLGLPFIFWGFVWMLFIKRKYVLVISGNSGTDENALVSKNRKYIENVLDAINSAIIQKG